MGSLEGRHLHASIESRLPAKGQEASYFEIEQNKIAAIEPLTMRHLDPSQSCSLILRFNFTLTAFLLPSSARHAGLVVIIFVRSISHRRSLLSKKTNINNKSIP